MLLFATEKQRKRKKIVHVLLRPKVPKASARRFPRECASRGAARGAQDQAYAPPRDGRAAARTLFFRVKRECGFIVPPAAALLYNALWKPVSTYLSCPPPAACHFCFAKPTTLATPFFLFSARRFPTWFRWRKSGRRAESDSGGDGLLANPRIVARRRFQTFGRRHRNRSGGFCCFSPPKSREKRKSFPQEDRKSQKVFERTFAAAFRHRKAEKKRRRGTKTHLRTEKSADHGAVRGGDIIKGKKRIVGGTSTPAEGLLPCHDLLPLGGTRDVADDIRTPRPAAQPPCADLLPYGPREGRGGAAVPPILWD